MTKTLSVDLTYDAPLEKVAAMLADPAFREAVCERQRALHHTVSIEGTTVAIRYAQAVRGVPSFAAKFVGDAVEIEQDETWNADWTSGELTVALPGKPGNLTGTAVLRQAGAQTVETITLTAKVSVPLVGGKLEDLVLGVFRTGLLKEQEVGATYLAG